MQSTSRLVALISHETWGCAARLQSELYLALDRKYITDAELQATHGLADEVKRLINELIAYLRKAEPSTPSSYQVREIPEPHSVIDYQTNDKGLFD